MSASRPQCMKYLLNALSFVTYAQKKTQSNYIVLMVQHMLHSKWHGKEVKSRDFVVRSWKIIYSLRLTLYVLYFILECRKILSCF